jgi:hyperosmotically inducible protein
MNRKLIPVLVAAAGLGLGAPLAYADTARQNLHDAKENVKDAAHDTKNAVQDAAHDTAARLDPDKDSQPVKDAYIHGKVEGAFALNSNVSAYQIDTDVKNGVVTLTGAVDSDVERDLAVEVARGIDGVTDVKADGLMVKAGSRETARMERDKHRSVGQTLDDAGTTAAIKTKLLANKSTSGLKINVDTKNGVVTLRGNVASSAEKDLAEQIARNSSDTVAVHNELSVAKK